MSIDRVVWDVDKVWYHDISTTYCAKGRQGDPAPYIQAGLEKGWYTRGDIDRWVKKHNNNQQPQTIGEVANMFTAFLYKMTKPDGSPVLTKQQTIELKQGLLRGMTLREVREIAKEVAEQYMAGLVEATGKFRNHHIQQIACSDGLGPFVAWHMNNLCMNHGEIVPAVLEPTYVFTCPECWQRDGIEDYKLTGRTRPFDKHKAISTTAYPLSQAAVIDDSKSNISTLKEVQEAGGLAVGFRVNDAEAFKQAGIPVIKGEDLRAFQEIVLDPSKLRDYCE